MDKRKRKRTVYTHSTSAEETSLSNASKRRVHVQHNPAPPRSPEKGRAFDNFDHLMGFAGDEELPAPVLPEGPAALTIKVKKQAKRYDNSDHPVKSWIPERDNYQDGLLQLKGRGPMVDQWLRCMSAPQSYLAEWEDDYFKPRTTRDLKIRYQIGHPFGEDCPTNYLGKSGDFVVLHDNGIHVLDVDFCCCTGSPSQVAQLLNIGWFPATHKDPSTAATLSMLRRFHRLNLQARLPAYDFYNTLVILSDGAGLRKLPKDQNRLPQFMNMMCKRAGRGHDPDGISATTAGELAIPCRACPHPDINLPEDWDKAPSEVAWIYRLMVSEDANFKMKGRDRSSREERTPPSISHCVSFAALWSANNKRAKGLRASGVGSVSCSRHEVFRPLGTGDLQRGECLIGVMLLTVVASYDIACQWGRNFWKRAKGMPESLQLQDWVQIISREWEGRTVEGVERNWSWLNLAARSVSVMGPGAREDTIDDLCGFSNWKKTVDLGHEEDLTKWERKVREWEMDSGASESPYEYAEVEDVLARLAAEEHASLVRDGASALVVKPGPFLIAGIEIQQSQAALVLEAKRKNRTTIQATTLQRSRTLLLGKVQALHDIQDTYMPGLRTWIAQQSPTVANRQTANTHLCHWFKRKNMEGQGAYTKSRELVDGIEDRIRSAAMRYRTARAALYSLRGHGLWEQKFQELRQEDIRGMNERALNDEEKEENRKARLMAGLSADADGDDIDDYSEPTVLFHLETGEGRRTLSWIWYTGSIKDSDVAADGSLMKVTSTFMSYIRIEWTKARARADRWREELILLEEEMRRVLEFCGWKARWWDERSLRKGCAHMRWHRRHERGEWVTMWREKWAAVRERATIVMRDHVVDAAELVATGGGT
ncbi:hypothetical protein B0H14DRAFT_2564086 [Mycena olivaceomarginata]|nr:hypothetical protein B0H14DRAFT_2564086 [Mycena olivaceomarginata]